MGNNPFWALIALVAFVILAVFIFLPTAWSPRIVNLKPERPRRGGRIVRLGGVFLALAALAACQTSQILSASQTAEKTATEGELLYVATVTAANAYPGGAAACKLDGQAWTALGVVRVAYATDQAISLLALANVQAQIPTKTGERRKVALKMQAGISVVDVLAIVEQLLPAALNLISQIQGVQSANTQAALDTAYASAQAQANALQPPATCG